MISSDRAPFRPAERLPLQLGLPSRGLVSNIVGAEQKTVIFENHLFLWAGSYLVARSVIGALLQDHATLDGDNFLERLARCCDEIDLAQISLIYSRIDEGRIFGRSWNCSPRSVASVGYAVAGSGEQVIHSPFMNAEKEINEGGSPSVRFVFCSFAQLAISEMVEETFYYFSFGGAYEMAVLNAASFQKVPYDILLFDQRGSDLFAFRRLTRVAYAGHDMVITSIFENGGSLAPNVQIVEDFLRRPSTISVQEVSANLRKVEVSTEEPRMTFSIVVLPRSFWQMTMDGSKADVRMDGGSLEIQFDKDWLARLRSLGTMEWEERNPAGESEN